MDSQKKPLEIGIFSLGCQHGSIFARVKLLPISAKSVDKTCQVYSLIWVVQPKQQPPLSVTGNGNAFTLRMLFTSTPLRPFPSEEKNHSGFPS